MLTQEQDRKAVMERVGKLLSGLPNRTAKRPAIDWPVLASVPVSAADKEQIRLAAAGARLSFQEFVIGAIRRRLVGRPPVVRIERAAGAAADSSIGCSFTQSEKMKIVSAARALGITVHEFLRGAIFGEYAPAAEVLKPPALKPEPPKQQPPGTIRIGAGEKRRIERAARFWNLPFDEYVAEAAARRLAGLPPMSRVPRSLFPDKLVDVVCGAVDIERVCAAARAANLSPEEYLTGAVFGDYRFRRRRRKPRPLAKDAAPEGETPAGAVSETEPKNEPEKAEGKTAADLAAARTEINDRDRACFDYAHSNYKQLFESVKRRDGTLEAFVDEIQSIMPPQYGEFMKVIRQARSGDQKARNRAAEMYLRVAVRTAYRSAKKYDFDLDDSIGDACLGLLTEIDRFRLKPGKRSFSGVVWRMDSAILRTNSKCRTGIRFPVQLNDLYCKLLPLLKQNNCLSAKTNADWERISRILPGHTGGGKNRTAYLLERLKPVRRVESLVPRLKEIPEDTDNTGYVEFDDSVVPSRDDEPADQMAEREKYRFARLLLHRLDRRERKILRLRYGIADGRAYTLEEIGKVFGITRERVRQIECRAMKKLRRFVEEAGIRVEDYL